MDDIRGEPFSFEEPGEPPAPDLRFESGKGPELFLGLPLGHVDLRRFRKEAVHCLFDDVASDAFLTELLLDPAPAEAARPGPASGPLAGEQLIIEVAEAKKMIDDGRDKLRRELAIAKFFLHLGAAARADGKKSVRGIPRPLQFFITRIVPPHLGPLLGGNNTTGVSPHASRLTASFIPEPVDLEFGPAFAGC